MCIRDSCYTVLVFRESAMPFPNFDYCLLCEGVRFEIGNKFTILGFYGMTPNNEIVVSNPAMATGLAFLVGFPPVSRVAQTGPAYERIEICLLYTSRCV